MISQAKLLAYLFAFVGLIGTYIATYEYGKHAQQAKDQLIFDKMAQQAKDQQIAAQQKEIAQNEVTYKVAETYTADNDRLNAAVKRLHDQLAKTSPSVSTAADSAKGFDAVNRERSRACEGSTFYVNALRCELKLGAFRDFVIKEKLPVR